MPNDDESQSSESPNNIIAAIEYNVQPGENASAAQAAVDAANRGPQPRNLQDLLRYSISVDPNLSVSSSAPPLDEERKELLMRALDFITGSATEELKNAIRVIVQSDAGNDDPEECCIALDTLSSFVDDIDTANDFFKIGGFSIFKPCLNSPHGSIRSKAASIMADLTQNNPFCQRHSLEAGYLPLLLNSINDDPDEQTRIKALYALSCLMRDNANSIAPFLEHDGLSVLLRAILSDIEKLKVKSGFLLSVLCKENHKIRVEMCKMGFVELFASILSSYEPSTSDDYILAALKELVADNPPAIQLCRNADLKLELSLMKIKNRLFGSQDKKEEFDHAYYLLTNVFHQTGETDQTEENER